MGTPDFAVGTLKALVENHYNVVAVVTMPDKPMGRHGSVLQSSAVKQYALSVGLPVLQPERLKDEAFLEALRAFRADLQIVVAFRMLPEVVWAMPPKGTFNLHASLLPQYRGAAPINWAIINGDKETGVTTFFLQHEIDTGEIIHQERIAIGEEDDVEVVHDRLMELGATLVLRTVDDIAAGTVTSVPQPVEDVLRPAPKIFRETCHIDWHQPAAAIHNFVRGLSPYPAAWTDFIAPDGTVVNVKIFSTRLVEEQCPVSNVTTPGHPAISASVLEEHLQPGVLESDGKSFLHVATSEGLLSIESLQVAGKKRMPVADFLRGHADITLWQVR